MRDLRSTRSSKRRTIVVGTVAALAALALGAPSITASAAPSTPNASAPQILAGTPTGYAAGTTGGGSASPTTVTSLSAFQSAVSGNQAKVVQVSGLFSLSGQVDVGSNTTIVGVGSNSGFTGGGLRLLGVSNVIIQNLNISKPIAPSDAITVQLSSRVWIDHNTLSADRDHDKDYYDGLLDITHAGDNVTVSWNKFANHFKGSLVGHSDSNGSEDTGHLKVTYHHNWFSNVYSRIPSLRFGTGHVYNNLIEGADTAVHSRMGAQVLVENNVFRDTKLAITTMRSSDEDGYVVQRNNDFGGAALEISQTGSFSSPPYSYSLDATSSVASVVTSGAGAGH